MSRIGNRQKIIKVFQSHFIPVRYEDVAGNNHTVCAGMSTWPLLPLTTKISMTFPTDAEFAEVRECLNTYLHEELIPFEKENGIGYEDQLPKEVVRSLWKRSRELNLYGMQLPRDLGGRGMSVSQLCLLKDDVAASGAVLFPHVLGDWGGPSRIGNLVRYATPYQVENYILPCIRGEKGACFAMTEPASGSDAASIRTRAVRDGDEYVITGRKHYITASAFADFAVVMCVTDPDKGADGISAILVDFDRPGVKLSFDYLPMTGQHVDADIDMAEVRVPAANLIGKEGAGFKIAMDRVSVNRLLHCPTMIGLARQAYRLAVDYSQHRQQFGGPISRFQAIQHMLADMATALFACESMVLAAAKLADDGRDIRKEASMCKLFVSERCFEIADKAMQIHGNVGVTKNHPVEFIFRRLRLYRIVTGTSEIQRNTIAKEILRPAVASPAA
jgi:alkylation response protein AidB-like acyl-CoA dehydrogenase